MRPRFMALHRKDLSEPLIREALEAAGFEVHDKLPCDLIAWRADVGWKLLETKTPTKTGKQRKRKDQEEQAALLLRTGIPVVLTPEAALREAKS